MCPRTLRTHCIGANAPVEIKLQSAQIDIVVGITKCGILQRHTLGRLGDDVLVLSIDQRDERAVGIEANGAKLGQSGQYVV